LGRRVKEQGFSLKVVHGEKHIKAVWARDTSTLWHGLRRLLIPLYEKEKIKAYIMVIATFVLLLLPLIILPFSIIIVIGGKGVTNDLIILFLSITSILLLVINNVLQLKYTVFQNPWYALAFPLAGSFVLVAFLSSIIQSKQKNVINWRDRKYSIREEK
jgi:chlorobactene glucosyltransferase